MSTERPKGSRASEAVGGDAADGGDVSLTLAREVLVASIGLKGDEAAANARYQDALERATEYRETAFAVLDHLAKYGISATMLAAGARGVEHDDALADLFRLVEAFRAGDDIEGVMVAGLETVPIPISRPTRTEAMHNDDPDDGGDAR